MAIGDDDTTGSEKPRCNIGMTRRYCKLTIEDDADAIDDDETQDHGFGMMKNRKGDFVRFYGENVRADTCMVGYHRCCWGLQ